MKTSSKYSFDFSQRFPLTLSQKLPLNSLQELVNQHEKIDKYCLKFKEIESNRCR